MKASQIQSFLFLGLLAFFVAHFVLLSPSGLEEDFNGVRILNPKDLLGFLTNSPNSAFKEVPTDIAPSYSMRDMVFYSSGENNKPGWKISARKSNLYQAQQMVHGMNVTLELPDQTTVTADEAIFFTQKDQGEFHGNVHTLLRDGTTMDTQYAKVNTRPVMKIEIPVQELVTGEKKGSKKNQTSVVFHSHGMSYTDVPPQEIKLLTEVNVDIRSVDHQQTKSTLIDSDQANYQHLNNFLVFLMDERRPLSQQFVRVHQVDLDLKSRTLEVNLEADQKLNTVVAKNDVWMKDAHDPLHISTATSGRAIFYDQKNEIHLNDYPQVYQDGDTVTGDVIVFDRNRDTIDVRESNATYQH